MTAKDRWGHSFIDEEGRSHQFGRYDRISDPHWVLNYHYSENDGWTFMNRGSEREICAEINCKYSSKFVKEVLEKCRERRTLGESELSLFEKMAEKKRQKETVSDPDQ